MSAKFGLCVFSCLVLLLSVLMAFDAVAGENPWSGKVRPGFMAGDGDDGTDFYLDVLIPLYGDERQLFFFNPNLRFDDNDGNEQNIGFGYRSLLAGQTYIFGANAYYDSMESETGHRYHQWGVGAELLSHWVDLRANYYNVFGDDENVLSGSGGSSSYFFSGNSLMSVGGSIEQALDGFDAEVSFLVPGISDVMETRLAGTYYRYDADHAKDPDGWRGRVEIRPVQAVNLSVEYRDDDLRGSDTFVGAYFEIPFAIDNLFAGKNPFAGAGEQWAFGKGVRQLEERMTDKVVRDRHIVAVQSGTATGGSELPVVDDAMIFVNQDNTKAGDGSFENPYQTLDSTVADERFAPGAWIYVFSSDEIADTYENTSLTLLDDQVLWGQGYEHPVYGLGGGLMPILDGGYTEAPVGADADPVIQLANNNEIMGFVIQRGLEGIYVDTYQTGRTSTGVNIHHNIIRDNLSFSGVGSGIHINNIFTADDLRAATLSYVITDNQIDNNDRTGIYLRQSVAPGELVGTTFDTVITGNTMTNHDTAIDMTLYVNGDPILIQDVTVTNRIEDNLIADSAGGIRLRSTLNARSDTADANLNSQINNTIRNNTINVSRSQGIYVDNEINAQGYSSAQVRQARVDNLLEGNVVSGASTGIFINNKFYSFGDFNDIIAESRLAGNTVSIEEPQYPSDGISVTSSFRKNTGLAQGPIEVNVFGEANRVTDLSSTPGRVTGVQLRAYSYSSAVADDYITATLFDFGGGALDSTGGNSFTGFETGEIALSNSSQFSVAAENNWWGTTDSGLIDAMIGGTGSGSVDYEPYLSSAP